MDKPPAVGTVLHSDTTYKILIRESERYPGQITATISLEFVDGKWIISNKGLIVFLNDSSRKWLRASNPELYENLEKVSDGDRQLGDFVTCSLPLRITSYASTGRAAHGQLII